MEERDIYLIPRNLNKSDTIIHKPISLNWKDLSYLGISVGGIILAATSSLSPFLSSIIIIASSLIGVFGATFRYDGLMLHELVKDVIIYFIRKYQYKIAENGD